ncbi:MAG: CHAT domain-containing protein [Acidobacteriota bacterium]
MQAKDILVSGEILVTGEHLAASDLVKAISVFEKSRDLFAAAGDVCEAALAENSAAQYLPDVARIAESRQRFAAMITDAESRKFNVLLPPAYYWLAVSDFRQTGYSNSNKRLKTALRLATAGENVFEIQHAAEHLTLNYSELGELESALSYASRMISARGTYYESASQSLRDLGTLADLSLKLKFARTSLSLSKEALNLAQDNWPDSARVNGPLRHLIRAATETGDLSAALEYANEAQRVALRRGGGAEQTRTIAESHLLLAEVESKMKNCLQAVADYDQALDLYRRLPEFTFDSYQIHKGKLFCFQQLDREEDFSRELQTVLHLSENYRATIREDDSRRTFFANEQDVFDVAAVNAIRKGDRRRAFEFVEESRARSLLDFVESTQTIAQVEKNFASVARPLSLEEIQSRLPEQVQLVQYAVLPDRLAIWVLSRTRFDLIEKPIEAASLEKKIDDYQASVVGKAPATGLKQAARELYQLLIPPDLAGDKQICLVPDKSLHQLAFASLVSPGGKYFLEDFALFYAPSASVLVLATENARRKDRETNERLLSIGNPDFDREENPNLPDLESAEVEVKSISGNYARSSRNLLGGEATKEAFLNDLNQVEVVHFAGHFLANRQSPGNSKLLFAGGELRSSELSAYKLTKMKLAILSACQTGFEGYDKGEGAIGIARTFLALGAPLVVASQWRVDSEPTKDLMVAFHRNRKERRLASAESLRQAQLEVLSNDKTQAPFYWAAFSLFGGYANY